MARQLPEDSQPRARRGHSYIRLSGQIRYGDRLYNRQGLTGRVEDRVVPFKPSFRR